MSDLQALLFDASRPAVEIGDWKYRYALRHGAPLALAGNPAVFCMLNPSTATADADDATVRRLKGFARAWMRDCLVIVNLYALRSRFPNRVAQYSASVGPANDFYLEQIASHSQFQILCAWGSHAEATRAADACAIFRVARCELRCLGVNADGQPKHPLYLPKDSRLITFAPPQASSANSKDTP